MPNRINRRQSLQSLAMVGLACSFSDFAFADKLPPSLKIEDWLDRLYENAQQLGDKKISGLRWQEAMEVLYGEVPIPELKHRLDFASLQKQILDSIGPERGELFRRIDLQGDVEEGADDQENHRSLIIKVAHIKKGRSIPPHGHSNMASAFLCISGEFAVRQYDKIEDSEDNMVLRQTVDDSAAGVGTWSSISDYRNNVHWLTANTDDCYLFTSKLIGLETGRPLHGRINVDVKRAESLGSDTIRAPKISFKEAAERY